MPFFRYARSHKAMFILYVLSINIPRNAFTKAVREPAHGSRTAKRIIFWKKTYKNVFIVKYLYTLDFASGW